MFGIPYISYENPDESCKTNDATEARETRWIGELLAKFEI